MNLAAKYVRSDLIRDGEVQAWNATIRSSGEPVVLYLFTGAISPGESISEFPIDQLRSNLGEKEERLDSGIFGLSPCLVAKAVSVSAQAPQVSRPSAPPVPPPASAPEPVSQSVPAPNPVPAQSKPANEPIGEFTSMFGAALAGSSSEAAGPNGSAPREAASPPVKPEPPSAVQSPAPQPSPAKQPSPAPQPNPAQESEDEMGSFTRMFMAAGTPPSGSQPSEPRPPAGEPPAVAADTPAGAPFELPTPAAEVPARGEFTALFQAADSSGRVPPPQRNVPSAPAQVERPVSSADSSREERPAPEPATAPDTEEPGDFTLMFRAANPQKAEPAAEEPSAPPTPAPPFLPPQPAPVQNSKSDAFDETAEMPAASEAEEFQAEEAEPTLISLPQAEARTAPASDSDEIGEFTQLFQAPLPESSPAVAAEQEVRSFSAPPPPQSSAPEPPAAGKSVESASGADSVPLDAVATDSTGAEAAPVQAAFSSASPAKGPIRFTAADKASEAEEAPKPPRSPLQSGSFSQTYVSTNEMPVMREPSISAPASTPEDAPGDFTQLFATPGGAGDAPLTPAAEPAAASTPAAGPPVPSRETPPASTPAGAGEPGEFTRFFKPGEVEKMREEVAAASKPPVVQPPAASAETSRPASPAHGEGDPGEFTRMFSPGDLPAKRPEPAKQSEPPKQNRGAFTDLYLAAQGDKPPVVPSNSPSERAASPSEPAKFQSDKERGSFTNLFMAAQGEPQVSTPASEAASNQEQGSFTNMFMAAQSEPSTPSPSSSEAGGRDQGTFTNLYMAAKGESSSAPPAAPANAAPPDSSTPGGFTSMFQAAASGAPEPAPSSAVSDVFAVPPSRGGLSIPPPSSDDEPSFTTYFQSGELTPSAPAPVEESKPPSPDLPAYSSGYSRDATQFFQAAPQQPAPQATGQMRAQGPGEYTRMISGEELRQAMEQGGPGGPGAASGGTAPSGGGGGGGMSMPAMGGVPVSGPQFSGPHMQGPQVSGPYVQAPQVSSSGVSAPHVQGPHVQGPHMQGPHMSTPHASTPHMQTPHMQTPHMQTPHMQTPQMSTPPMQMPPAGGAPSAGAPVPAGQGVQGGRSATSSIVIVATVIVTIIAVALVLLVLYFALR